MTTPDIIDNRNQKLVDSINCILDSSDAAHFAVGYFFLSGFIAIAPRLTNIKEMRLLIGNTSNRETIEQLAEGYRRLELIKDKIEAQTYPKRILRQEMVLLLSVPLISPYPAFPISLLVVKRWFDGSRGSNVETCHGTSLSWGR
ncbi:MAG: hypothetical protein RIM23_24545 [Coleofasciculus sp. G3-WIS-01]